MVEPVAYQCSVIDRTQELGDQESMMRLDSVPKTLLQITVASHEADRPLANSAKRTGSDSPANSFSKIARAADTARMSIATAASLMLADSKTFLQPIDGWSTVAYQGRSISRQFPKFSFEHRGDETCLQQPMLKQLGDPFCISHVRLFAQEPSSDVER